MKCVRIVGQGVPVRMPDEKAEQIIAEGDGQYCSKQFWKEWWKGVSCVTNYLND